jgi:hypothetical protein
MIKPYLSIMVAAVLLNGATHAADAVSTASTSHRPGMGSGLIRVAGRLQGRVRGTLLRQGMTPSQVERLLGKGYLSSGGLAGCFFFQLWKYQELGLTVSFTSDSRDEYRVSAVTFWLLSD